jgi:hypothetical protein
MAVRVDNRIANFIVREEEWLGLEYTTGFFCVVCGGCDDVDCVGVAYTTSTYIITSYLRYT